MLNIKRFMAPIGAIALSLLTFTTPVSAGHVNQCLSYNPNDHLNDVTIGYFHASVGSFSHCVANNEFFPESSNPYWREVRNVVSRMTNFRNDLDRKLKNKLEEEVRAAIAGKASFKSANATITGDITISLKGQPDSNGTLQLELGGFGLDAIARFEKSWYANGKVTVKANNLKFAANYNVNTGLVTLVRPVYSHFDIEVDTSSPLSFILPFLEIGLNYLENKYEDELRDTFDNFVETTVSSYEKTLFSLDQEIPTGAFIFNGVDYGVKVKDQISHFVEDIDVSISQGGKSLSDAYVNIQVQNIRISAGRKHFVSKFANCPHCELP